MYTLYNNEADTLIHYTDFSEFAKLIGITYNNQYINMYVGKEMKHIPAKYHKFIQLITEQYFSHSTIFLVDTKMGMDKYTYACTLHSEEIVNNISSTGGFSNPNMSSCMFFTHLNIFYIDNQYKLEFIGYKAEKWDLSMQIRSERQFTIDSILKTI